MAIFKHVNYLMLLLMRSPSACLNYRHSALLEILSIIKDRKVQSESTGVTPNKGMIKNKSLPSNNARTLRNKEINIIRGESPWIWILDAGIIRAHSTRNRSIANIVTKSLLFSAFEHSGPRGEERRGGRVGTYARARDDERCDRSAVSSQYNGDKVSKPVQLTSLPRTCPCITGRAQIHYLTTTFPFQGSHAASQMRLVLKQGHWKRVL